jgi:hypothetical protein
LKILKIAYAKAYVLLSNYSGKDAVMER